MKTTPEPGIYRDVREADYRAWDANNVSAMKHAAKSLAHYRYEKLHPSPPTAAMELGRALHCCVLEPDRFPTDYAGAPKVDRRTNVGKETWAAFQMDNVNATILTEEDYGLCLAMSEAAWAHPLASEILKGAGSNELSMVWKCPDSGLLCKGRIDRLTEFDGWTQVVDVKSAKDASPEGFSRAIAEYDYHWPHYLDGLNVCSPRDRRMSFIAIEKTPPHAVAIYTLNQWAIEQGRDELRAVKLAIAEAKKTDVWPGYPAEVVELELPRWRQRRLEEW